MSPMSCSRCVLLVIILFSTCALIVHGKGGRGGGSRGGGGGWGRSSSSRSSSSSSSGYSYKYGSSSSSGSSSKYGSSSGGSSYKYGSSSGGSSSKYGSSPSSGTSSFKYPSYSSSVKDPSSFSGGSASHKPGSFSSFEADLARQEAQMYRALESYRKNSQLPSAAANYPRQQFSFGNSQLGSQSPSIPNVNYPRQPSYNPMTFGSSQHSPSSLGIPNANYPRQPSHNPMTFGSSQHSPSLGIPNVNYPRQPSYNPMTFGSSQHSPSSPGIPNANYPRQPIPNIQGLPSHSSFQLPHISNANYPRQPLVPSGTSSFQGIPNVNYPKQPILSNSNIHHQSSSPQASLSNANYPRQPNIHQSLGGSSQQGFQNANYPRQAISSNPSVPVARTSPLGQQPSRSSVPYSHPQTGISNANYPRQPPNYQSLPPQVLGSGVWNPKSGMPAPVYMNYGGLPTGANMYTKPIKKQGLLGSLMSMGGSSKSYKSKHYSSYPSPYGLGGGMPANVLGGFMGSRGSKAAMYTILPYKVARKSSKLFRPKFGFYSYRPIRYHSYHHHSYMHDPEYERVHYDVYNNDYVGRCNRPIKPDHAKIVCNSTHNQVDCDVTCEEGYRYNDNTSSKMNKCWHASGTWNPTKNFPACKPVCDKTCLNGGKCVSPEVCGCPAEYRGPRCESHFLNCDIRKLANGTKILWVCTHTKNETSCRVKCKDPLEFATPSDSNLYKCTPDGVWTPSSMPLCVVPSSVSEESVTKTPEDPIAKVTAA